MTTLIRFDGLVAEQLPARAKAWRNMDGEERLKHQAGRVAHASRMKMLWNPRSLFSAPLVASFFVAWPGEPALVEAVRLRADGWGVYNPLYFIRRAVATENIVARIAELVGELGITAYLDSDQEVCRAVKERASGLLVVRFQPITIKERKTK